MREKKKFEYKWIIAGCCFLMIFGVLGFACGNKALYLSAITEALNIPRSLFSINDSLRYIAQALVNLAFGVLVVKFGARKLIAAGFVSLAISLIFYIFAENIAMFYLGGIFLGVGLGWTGTATVGYVVNRWFTQNKGTIMGVILCSNGLGTAIGAQIITPIIYDETNPFGYRNAYKLCLIVLVVVAVIVVALFRNSPGINVAKEEKKPKTLVRNGLPFNQAVKKPYFYSVAICVFLTGAALQGITGISSAHLKDVGIDTAFIATAASIHSLVLLTAKFLTGYIHDKFGLRVTTSFCYIAATVAFVALALSAPTAGGKTLAIVYSIFSSLALPLETIMVPLITGDIFGQASYAKMLGVLMAVNTAGYACGAFVVNFAFDIVGTYLPVLYISAALFFGIMITFLITLKTVDKEQALTEQVQEQTT
ncbi:MAG: MFS transporter [Clostridia bacterium]|nr:MFS transporter [Clostridia bacterium]